MLKRLALPVLVSTAAIIVAVNHGWTTWPSIRDTLTLAAELGIALAIYYEVEENRAVSFLDSVSEEIRYTARAQIYEAYVACPGATLAERAHYCRDELRRNADLRKTCDAQWMHFTRLQYGLSRSLLHRNLLAEWYPHVIVSMWAMLGLYIGERQKRRPSTTLRYFKEAVSRSLTSLERNGIRKLGTFGKEGTEIVITERDLAAFRRDLDEPFGLPASTA